MTIKTKLYHNNYKKVALVNSFSALKYVRNNQVKPIAYALYRDTDNNIRLVHDKGIKYNLEKSGYQLISEIPASKREIYLANITLKELLRIDRKKRDDSNFSRRLIKHLETLFCYKQSSTKLCKRYLN